MHVSSSDYIIMGSIRSYKIIITNNEGPSAPKTSTPVHGDAMACPLTGFGKAILDEEENYSIIIMIIMILPYVLIDRYMYIIIIPNVVLK